MSRLGWLWQRGSFLKFFGRVNASLLDRRGMYGNALFGYVIDEVLTGFSSLCDSIGWYDDMDLQLCGRHALFIGQSPFGQYPKEAPRSI